MQWQRLLGLSIIRSQHRPCAASSVHSINHPQLVSWSQLGRSPRRECPLHAERNPAWGRKRRKQRNGREDEQQQSEELESTPLPTDEGRMPTTLP